MADPYASLPADDESVTALTADFDDFVATAVPGWAPSDGALEVALRAGWADEASTLYSLLREDADDEWVDFGQTILGVSPALAGPASTTTTWTATDTIGHLIPGGTQIIINAATGAIGAKVVNDITITPGDDTAAGVLIQVLDQWAGSAANGQTGDILFDAQPAWVQSVTLDAALDGGSDAQTMDDYNNDVARTAQQLDRTPVLPAQFELAAQEDPTIARCLVRDGYDESTGESDQERTVSMYPIGPDGLVVSSGAKTALQAKIEARRETDWVVRVADPTYTVVNIDITVSAEDGNDHDAVAAAVTAMLQGTILNPALWGQPDLGQQQTFKYRTVMRRYEVAVKAGAATGVYDVQAVTMSTASASPSAADVTLTGSAPLPTAGTINVTVVDPT